jgi:hypothetical protein
MTSPDSAYVSRIMEVIRNTPVSAADDFSEVIEGVLAEELKPLPMKDRLKLLEEVASHFKGPTVAPPVIPGINPSQFTKLLSLLLGKGVTIDELSSQEASARLAKTLNTVFDTLNQIIGVMNSTLMGREGERETIRHLISSEVKGETSGTTLEGYLDQIQEAFLVAHKASNMAAEAFIHIVLSELDPEKMKATSEGRLKFGVLRKAELFETYQKRVEACKKALESGRLTEGFMREFEKACVSLYKEQAGREL